VFLVISSVGYRGGQIVGTQCSFSAGQAWQNQEINTEYGDQEPHGAKIIVLNSYRNKPYKNYNNIVAL
jgi:hypothetical protein